MFRLTVRAAVELALTLLLGLIGLILLLGTMDEYKAGRAFNRAMDGYAAGDMEAVREALSQATEAKPGYSAPQEAMGKLLVDEGQQNPAKYREAKQVFEALVKSQEASGGRASLPSLIGLAIAELEGARAQDLSPEALRAAISEARSRLEQARTLYPGSGDLYVNLATVAVLEDNLDGCEQYLAKVRGAGDISPDALPFLYNLCGLAALRRNQTDKALAEFEKVKEFAPGWEVPRLNLAASYAQGLINGTPDRFTADRYVVEIHRTLDRLAKGEKRLVPQILHALAIHCLRYRLPERAAEYFKQAEDLGPLSWHARFNRAITRYLLVRRGKVPEGNRLSVLADVRRDFAEILKNARATRRDTFVATCILGELDASQNDLPGAITRFESALQAHARPSDTFLQDGLLRVHRNLGGLYYTSGQYKKALEELQKSEGIAEQAEGAALLVAQLRSVPVVARFSAELAKILTEHDLRISAQVAAGSGANPLTSQNVRLTLTNALTGATGPIPFRLIGSQLRAVLLDLPQGKFRAELQLTDAMGNQSPPASKEFEIDREPPRVLDRNPAPNATVQQLSTIQFRLDDAISRVDLPTLSVSLQYPRGAQTAMAMLVSRGKYQVAAKDGGVKKGEEAAPDVACPVPAAPPPPPGRYTVTVRVQDSLGKKCEAEWSFTLAP